MQCATVSGATKEAKSAVVVHDCVAFISLLAGVKELKSITLFQVCIRMRR